MTLTLAEATTQTDCLASRLYRRRPEVEKSERYFRGLQPLVYASTEWKAFHNDRFATFADNWCGVVASSLAERLTVNGFRLGSSLDVVTDDEKLLAADWDRNDMGAQSSQGFLQSIIAKRSHVLVWGDENDEPVATWEHPAQSIVAYDIERPRLRVAALKLWIDDDTEFATLYTADEVWKFSRPVFALTGRTESGLYVSGMSAAAGGWTLRDEGPIVNPMGVVPMVEVANRPMLGGEPISDIEGTIAMQDAINMVWAYLFAAADFASMPARVVMGQEPPKIPILDDNGQKIGEKPVDAEKLKNGRMLYLTGQNTTIGQWDSAKLDTFTDVINIAVRHVAAQSRTPIHYIVGELNNINGETLLAGETGLVKKGLEFHLFGSPPIREINRLFALVRGRNDLADACTQGRVLWADPQTRTQAQASDAALKDRQIGFSFQWIAENRYGLTPPEIERELARRQSESDSILAGVIGAPKDGNAGFIPAG